VIIWMVIFGVLAVPALAALLLLLDFPPLLEQAARERAAASERAITAMRLVLIIMCVPLARHRFGEAVPAKQCLRSSAWMCGVETGCRDVTLVSLFDDAGSCQWFVLTFIR
jgi:hypothetical protein